MAQRYKGRRRAYGSFKADVEDIVKETEERMLAVMRQSLQDVVDEAQLPVAKGGRMRVDTGFLRATGQASLNGMPSGLSVREKTERNAYDRGDTGPNKSAELQLGKMQFGATFYFGWTANYARYRELYDGFMEGALRNWGRIVAFNTDTIKQRLKK